jgi:NADH-quinone oxidoreductase subunit L
MNKITHIVTSNIMPFQTHLEMGIAIPAVLVGLIGIFTAMIFYRKETNLPDRIYNALGFFSRAAFRKFYIDEIYLFITKKIIFNYVSRPIAWFDRHVVDGSMNGISYVTNEVSERIKRFQSGQLQQYALVFVSGVVLITLLFTYLMTN